MAPPATSRRARVLRALQRLVVGAAMIFFAFVVFAWWALRTGRAVEYLRAEIIEQARSGCGAELAFESLKLDAIPPVVHLSGVVVDVPGGRFASVELASVALEVLPLLYGRIQVDKAALVAPAAVLELEGGAIANLPRCLAPDPNAPKRQAVPIAIGVRELKVERARFELIVPGQLDAKIDSIDLSLTQGRRGGAELSLGVRGATVALAKATLPVPRVSLRAHVAGALTSPRAVAIESLEIDAAGGQLALSGSIDLVGPVIESKLRLAIPLDGLPALFPELPPMRGKVEIEGSFAGNVAEPRGTFAMKLSGVGVDDMRLADEVSLEGRASRSGVEIRALDARLGDGHVRGELEVSLGEAPKLDAKLALEALPFGRLMACLGVEGAWVDWSADGKVTAAGTLSPFAIGGAVDVVLGEFRVWDRGWDRPELRGPAAKEHLMLGFPEVSVSGAWDADPDGFWIRGARLVRGTSTGTATARINVEDADGIDVRAALEPMDLAELGPVGGVELLGKGKVELRIHGPRSDLRGEGRLSLAGVSVAGVPLGDARSSASWHDYTVKLPDLDAQLLRSHYRSDTTLDFDPAFQLTAKGVVDDGRLEDVLVPLAFVPEEWGSPTGAMVAEFSVKGPIRRLNGAMSGTLKKMTLVDETLDDGDVELRFEDGVLVFDRIDLRKRGARLSGSAIVDPNTSAIAVKLDTEGMTLQRIDALRAGTEALDAPLEVSLDLGGTTQSFTGTLTASLGPGHAGPVEIAPGRLLGRIHGRTMDVTGALGGGKLRVRSTVGWTKGLPYEAKLELDPHDVPALVGGLLGETGWSGELSGSAELSGSLVAWRDSKGTIVADAGRFEMGEKLSLELAGETRLSILERSLSTRRIVLNGPSLRVSASGQLGAKNDLRLQARYELSALPTLFSQVEASAGVLTVDAVVGGAGASMDLLGTGHVERGALEWRGLPGRLSGGTADLTFSRSTVLIDRSEGRYADGVVTASGEVELERMIPARVRLEVQLDGVRPRFSYPKFDLTGTLTGPMVLSGRFGALSLTGNLAASRSVLRPKIDPRALIADPAARLAPQVYDPEKETLGFELGMALTPEDPLKLKDDTTEIDLYGDVTMTGTNQRVGLLGAMTVGRGRVGFIGREYTVESGTIELRDRYAFAPRFDIELSARACDAQITMALTGTLDSFGTTYSSKPEMEDTNIVSCLVRGIRVRDLENIRGDSRGSSAASLAGEALWRLSGVDQEVRKVLPVDQIEVTTEYSSRDRVYEPRILLAKELGEGKFRLEYSSSLVKNDEQRAAVRYRISPQLTLQYTWATSDDITVGDHGVDLKYRWEW